MARILIIDDDEDCLDLLEAVLISGNHTVVALTDGLRIAEAVHEYQPDLVITDILMPGVMGGGVYKAVREKAGTGLPVIISSGTRMLVKHEGDPLLKHCPKPVNSETLLTTVEKLISTADTSSCSSGENGKGD